MIQKKVSILGAYAVGKTSLMERFVNSIFSNRYKTTVGVHIRKKTLELASRSLSLVIWDLAGEDELVKLRTSYLRGSSGYLIVADGTRASTLETAVQLQKKAREILGDAPFVCLLNKMDLVHEWALNEESIRDLERRGWPVIRTSAKQNIGVQEAFEMLAAKLVEAHERAA